VKMEVFYYLFPLWLEVRFFISTVVMALAINAAEDKKIRVTRHFFLRDLTFMNITCIYLLVCMFIVKEINVFVSVGFLMIYFIFVIIVVIQSK